MEVVNLSKQNSILGQFVSELRNIHVQGDSMRFRRNIERIGEIMAYEISKRFEYETVEIETPLAKIDQRLPADRCVIASVFRAGLPYHNGFLNYFDHAENAFVSAYRKYTSDSHEEFEIHTEYVASPDLNGKTLLVVDPMLATGRSLESVLYVLQRFGKPKQIHIASVIASEEGVRLACSLTQPECKGTLWCAAIDPLLDEHAYIVPGLGDAGDLSYGSKQS